MSCDAKECQDVARPLISRAEAKAAGLKRYFTGVPCSKGHVAERFVSERNCHECLLERGRRYRDENPEKAKERDRRWREENAEKEKERRRRYREENPEKAYKHRYYEENLEKEKQRRRRYREENLEKVKEKDRRWREKNTEKVKENSRRRRAKKKGADGHYTVADCRRIYAEQEGICLGCKKPFPFEQMTADHIVALANGGSDWPSNIQMLCRPCNSSKGTKDDETFKFLRDFQLLQAELRGPLRCEAVSENDE
jgi:5-methylcytosine-specific restriction endonuclease McrA